MSSTSTRQPLPRVACGRRAPGSQLAGLAVGVGRRASGCSTSVRRRAARRRCSPARSSPSRRTPPGRASSRRTSGALGAANVRVVCADGRALPEELTGFDRALVDAPCSGLGVLAARPDLRWRSQPLPELQLELAAAPRPRACGRAATVVYSVCTVNRDEAEAVVDALRARGRRRPSPPPGPGSATPPARSSSRRCPTSTARAASSSRRVRVP